MGSLLAHRPSCVLFCVPLLWICSVHLASLVDSASSHPVQFRPLSLPYLWGAAGPDPLQTCPGWTGPLGGWEKFRQVLGKATRGEGPQGSGLQPNVVEGTGGPTSSPRSTVWNQCVVDGVTAKSSRLQRLTVSA